MPPSDPDRHAEDGALVQRAQAGDEEAVAEIYRKHVQLIYRYVRARVSDSATAEDLTSEIFVRALTALDRYEHRGAPLAAWLFRLARARTADLHRSNAHRPVQLLTESQLDETPDPEALADRNEQVARLRHEMQRLTDDQRDVLHLRFIEGYSLDKTAEVMGRTIGAVKSLQFRALEMLARYLK